MVLIRNKKQKNVFSKMGVQTVEFDDIDDSDALTAAAADSDVVIHCANDSHPPSAKALIKGLAERQKNTGNAVHYIHVIAFLIRHVAGTLY